MKTVAILACLFVLAAAVNANIFDQYIEFTTGTAKECAKKLGLGDDVVEKYRTERESTDVKTVGCLKACVLTDFNIMEGGKLSQKMIDDMIDTVSAAEPEIASKLKGFAATCAAETEGLKDECEIAMKYVNCCAAQLKNL